MNIFKCQIARFPAPGYIEKLRPASRKAELEACRGYGGVGDVYSNEYVNSFRYAKRQAGGVYLGIGSHQNFDHILRTRPDKVILIDVSPAVSDHLIFLRSVFKLAANPFEFLCLAGSVMPLAEARKVKINNDQELIGAINKRIYPTDQEHFPHEAAGDRAVAEQNLPLAEASLPNGEEYKIFKEYMLYQCDPLNTSVVPSRMLIEHLFNETFFYWGTEKHKSVASYQNDWLRSLSAYSFMRDLALSGNWAIIQGNLADPRVSAAILSSLPVKQKITVGYFSNVDKYLSYTGSSAAYYSNLSRLPWSASPLVLRTYSYAVPHKVDPFARMREGENDPFMYQALEGPAARFFEDPTPRTEEETVKFFLFREAMQQLSKYDGSFPDIRRFVLGHGNTHFATECGLFSDITSLDVAALTQEFLLSSTFNKITK